MLWVCESWFEYRKIRKGNLEARRKKIKRKENRIEAVKSQFFLCVLWNRIAKMDQIKLKCFVFSNRWQRNAIEHWNRTLITREWASKSVNEMMCTVERSKSFMLKIPFSFFLEKLFFWNVSCKRSLIYLWLFFFAFHANNLIRFCLLVPLQSVNVIEHQENASKTKWNEKLKIPYDRKEEFEMKPNAVMSTCGK